MLDPFGDAEPTATRRRCWRLLGLLDCARRALGDFRRAYAAGDPVSLALVYQLQEGLRQAGGHLGMLAATFEPAVRAQAAAEQAQRGPEEARRREAEGRLVVLGEQRAPARWTNVNGSLIS